MQSIQLINQLLDIIQQLSSFFINLREILSLVFIKGIAAHHSALSKKVEEKIGRFKTSLNLDRDNIILSFRFSNFCYLCHILQLFNFKTLLILWWSTADRIEIIVYPEKVILPCLNFIFQIMLPCEILIINPHDKLENQLFSISSIFAHIYNQELYIFEYQLVDDFDIKIHYADILL